MDATQATNQPTPFSMTETMRLLQMTEEFPALALKSRDEISRLYQIVQIREQQLQKFNQDLVELKVKEAEWDQEKKEHLQKQETLESELKATRTRLSRLIADKLVTNNAEICDLSDENRPTKIAERYAELYDNQWTEAFEILSKSIEDEKTIIVTLRDIFIDCWRSCMDLSHAQINELRRALMSEMDSGSGDGAEIPADILRHFQGNRKRCAATTIEAEFEGYRIRKMSLIGETTRLVQQVFPFVKECFRLAYYMAIQDCPIRIDLQSGPGDVYDHSHFRQYTQRGDTVDFIVWPCIFLHNEGPVLSKGIAQCRKSTPDVTADGLEEPRCESQVPVIMGREQLATETEKDIDIAAATLRQTSAATCDGDDLRVEDTMNTKGITDGLNVAEEDVTNLRNPNVDDRKGEQSHTATNIAEVARRDNDDISGRKSTNLQPNAVVCQADEEIIKKEVKHVDENHHANSVTFEATEVRDAMSVTPEGNANSTDSMDNTESNCPEKSQSMSDSNDAAVPNQEYCPDASHTRGPDGCTCNNTTKQSSPTRKGKNKNKNRVPQASSRKVDTGKK